MDRRIPLWFVLCCCLADTQAQKKDLIDGMAHLLHLHIADSNRKKNALIFSIVPVAPVNLGQKQAAVSAINIAFYAGTPSVTNLSSIYFIPYTNFTDRSGFIITPAIWLAHNRWNLGGDLRITRNSTYTYGVGAGTTTAGKDIVDYRYIRVYANANHQLWGPFSAGFGYDLDYYHQVQDEHTNGYPGVFSAYGLGTGSQTIASGLTFNLLFDRRRNSINPTNGFYSSLTFRINPNNDLKWRSITFDIRKYVSLSLTRRQLLCFWALYWGCYGDVPYLCLPGTALDAGGRTGRGYLIGRYRGKQMLYGETEFRFDLSHNGFWGGVLFSNLQSYTQPETGNFAWLLPAAGMGLRIKFNKRNDMNITLDIAVGKNSFNWYLNLGEFF